MAAGAGGVCRGLVKELRSEWLEARLEEGSRCGVKDVDLPE